MVRNLARTSSRGLRLSIHRTMQDFHRIQGLRMASTTDGRACVGQYLQSAMPPAIGPHFEESNAPHRHFNWARLMTRAFCASGSMCQTSSRAGIVRWSGLRRGHVFSFDSFLRCTCTPCSQEGHVSCLPPWERCPAFSVPETVRRNGDLPTNAGRCTGFYTGLSG
jgi:hypothetical protein